ncbi:MAG: IPTL-CTERM sorting domain-containing protein [Candidatus Bipolaricaulia bacterium]
MTDRLRVVRRWKIVLSAALAIALLSVVASAEDPCTKLPDLWLPPDGIPGLEGGGISIQETTGDVCEGGTITITVTVDNLSCGDAGPFDVTVYYDDLSNVIATQHVDGLPGCEFTVLTFTWDTGGVPAGEHEIIACADTGGDVIELNEGNNCLSIEEELNVRPNAPWIEATKTFDDPNGGTPHPGERIEFEVVLCNEGCADQEDNPGHEFTDTLPAGLTALNFVSATRGTISIDGNGYVWDGDIPAGGCVTLTFKAEIDGDVEDLTDLCNQGTVHWDSDGDGSNDAVEPTDDPDTPAEDDATCLTVEISSGPLPLSGTIDAPTLSEWGMIVAFVLFVLAFWRVSRRRKAAATG